MTTTKTGIRLMYMSVGKEDEMTIIASEQLTLFDFVSDAAKLPEVKPLTNEDDYVLVYLVTMKGGNQGNLFVLHREDAIKLCEDECSHGSARQGRWMFNCTSLSHFYDSNNRSVADRQARDTHGKLTPFVFLRDTGKQDKDFERLGIHKPDIDEISNILRKHGYEIKYQNGG